MNWSQDRHVEPGVLRDVHDTELWRQFQNDDNLTCQGLPPGKHSVRLAFAIAADGVQAYRGHHAKPHSMFAVAVAILNLPQWVRTQLNTLLLSMLMLGPNEPHDCQPAFNILADEFVYMYECGFSVWDAHR